MVCGERGRDTPNDARRTCVGNVHCREYREEGEEEELERERYN